jgi:fatty-acyl-CoA synthase
MIIRGGENVYPREIEEFLFTHPDVVNAQIVGVPDERLGEQVVAWVQRRPGSEVTEDDLIRFCRGKIAHFKVPEHIRFTDEFPMTVTGKVQKFRLRAMAIEERESAGITTATSA